MYALAGASLQAGPRLDRRFDLPMKDPESLLVTFLGELLYLGEQDGLAFDSFNLYIEGRITARQAGGCTAGFNR